VSWRLASTAKSSESGVRGAQGADRRARPWLTTRVRNLLATPAFLSLQPTEPELQLLHRFDNGYGLGLVAAGVEGPGHRLTLSHITRGGRRAMFMDQQKVGVSRLRRCGVVFGRRYSARRRQR
jgi:hypothetical protein